MLVVAEVEQQVVLLPALEEMVEVVAEMVLLTVNLVKMGQMV
jgi:hypothetical protein